MRLLFVIVFVLQSFGLGSVVDKDRKVTCFVMPTLNIKSARWNECELNGAYIAGEYRTI